MNRWTYVNTSAFEIDPTRRNLKNVSIGDFQTFPAPHPGSKSRIGVTHLQCCFHIRNAVSVLHSGGCGEYRVRYKIFEKFVQYGANDRVIDEAVKSRGTDRVK